MRFPAALLFNFSLCLIWTSCDNDDEIEQLSMIDCSSINTFDTSLCTVLDTGDSIAFVSNFLGSWYLAASQNSGFGGGSTECITYSEATSPFRFTFNDDHTWRLIDTENSIDTTLGWRATSGFGGYRLSSTTANFATPEFSHLCDENLVSDLRPLDGSLFVYARSN